MIVRTHNSAKLGFRKAWYSDDEAYRYGLRVIWDPLKPLLLVIGLNPSTATESQDDPTIRRCIAFAKEWGFGGILMCNLAAFRSTDPNWMFQQTDPIGPENTAAVMLRFTPGYPKAVLAAWGVHGVKLEAQVYRLIQGLRDEAGVPVVRLGTTANGHPRHPLYVPKDTFPETFELNFVKLNKKENRN